MIHIDITYVDGTEGERRTYRVPTDSKVNDLREWDTETEHTKIDAGWYWSKAEGFSIGPFPTMKDAQYDVMETVNRERTIA